jgi:hypothetical protein
MSRWTGLTPSTSIASISSRILRAPMSATALPPGPATSNAVISGLACCTIASALAAPVKDCAPICRVSEPSCKVMTAPNGIATSAVGRMVTLAKNQHCWIHSRSWKGRRKIARRTSHDKVDGRPTWISAAVPGMLKESILAPTAPPSLLQLFAAPCARQWSCRMPHLEFASVFNGVLFRLRLYDRVLPIVCNRFALALFT